MNKVIVCGGRGFTDLNLLDEQLHFFLSRLMQEGGVEIVSGTARGADTLAIRWASYNGVSVKCFRADWDRWGKAAGYRRNAEMAKYATHCIAFWDGQSKGTGHMIKLAREHNLALKIVRY